MQVFHTRCSFRTLKFPISFTNSGKYLICRNIASGRNQTSGKTQNSVKTEATYGKVIYLASITNKSSPGNVAFNQK